MMAATPRGGAARRLRRSPTVSERRYAISPTGSAPFPTSLAGLPEGRGVAEEIAPKKRVAMRESVKERISGRTVGVVCVDDEGRAQGRRDERKSMGNDLGVEPIYRRLAQ